MKSQHTKPRTAVQQTLANIFGASSSLVTMFGAASADPVIANAGTTGIGIYMLYAMAVLTKRFDALERRLDYCQYQDCGGGVDRKPQVNERNAKRQEAHRRQSVDTKHAYRQPDRTPEGAD